MLTVSETYEFLTVLKSHIIVCLSWESMNVEYADSQGSVFKVNEKMKFRPQHISYIELTVSLQFKVLLYF